MPYAANRDLPDAVRRHLPAAAQTVYRGVFNRAWQTYRRDERCEEIAHRVAWAAVKRGYRKRGERWVANGAGDAARRSAG